MMGTIGIAVVSIASLLILVLGIASFMKSGRGITQGKVIALLIFIVLGIVCGERIGRCEVYHRDCASIPWKR